MTAPSVVAIGDANIDVILEVDQYPALGGDARSERMHIQVGGSAANTCIVLAHLGVRAALLTTVGADIWGKQIHSQLQDSGVGTDLIYFSDEDTSGLMFIPVTRQGQRTIFGRRGANRKTRLTSENLKRIEAAQLLHLSGYAFYEDPQCSAAFRALSRATDLSIPVSLDTAFGPAVEYPARMREAAQSAAILVLGDQESGRIAPAQGTDSSTGALRSLGPDWIALKRGARGVKLIDRDQEIDLPSVRVPVLDTTGAGDAFTAGLLYGWMNSWDLLDAGLLASALGALATTVPGAGRALPQRPAVLQLLDSPGTWASFPNDFQPRILSIRERLTP